jgi:hypothetical protein
MGNSENELPPGHVGDVDFGAGRLVVVKSLVSQNDRRLGVLGADRLFSSDEPPIRLVEVERELDVLRDEPVASPHAVDLYGEGDGDRSSLERSSELHDRGSSEALSVDDEPPPVASIAERIADELLGNVPPPVLERLREDISLAIAQGEREPPHSLVLVIPTVSPSEKADDDAGSVGKGRLRHQVLNADATAAHREGENRESSQGCLSRGRRRRAIRLCPPRPPHALPRTAFDWP